MDVPPRIVVSDLRKAVEDRQLADQAEWRRKGEEEVARVQQTVSEKFRYNPKLEHTFLFKFEEIYHAGEEWIRSAIEAVFDKSVQVEIKSYNGDKRVTVKVA